MSEPTFELRLRRLEEIAAALEGDGVELNQALALFEEGIEQLRAAAGELARADLLVQQLIERADGSLDVVDRRE